MTTLHIHFAMLFQETNFVIAISTFRSTLYYIKHTLVYIYTLVINDNLKK